MAGDWIKVSTVLPDKPEVWGIAEALDLDVDAVVGKLFRVWAWFDQNTENGNAPIVTKKILDRITSVPGFADSMISVGWLADGETINLPNFDRHNGKTAKKRALTSSRVKRFRNDGGVTDPLPEKRREELVIPPTEDACASFGPGDPDRDWIWRDGIKLLAQTMPDRKARSCIGGWLKKHTAHQVRTAVVSAERAQTGDPVPYITRILGREARIVDELMAGLE